MNQTYANMYVVQQEHKNMENNIVNIKIYRNGELSRIETYMPIVKHKLLNFGNKIDYLFVNGHWPNAVVEVPTEKSSL